MKAKESVCIRVASAGVKALLVCEDPEQIGDQQAEGGGVGGVLYSGEMHQ